MLKAFILHKNSPKHIYLQIADLIVMQIEKGILKEGEQLPSINMFSEKYLVARDTVERAYKVLRSRGYINSVIGKGYFIDVIKNKKIKVLLILNKISNFKKIIYYSILNHLEGVASVDLEIYHYKPLVLNDILDRNLGKYNYYIVMPHFETSTKESVYCKIINRIPKEELILIDKVIPDLFCTKAVYQDFENDLYNALADAKNALSKYSNVTLLFPNYSNHPIEIIEGARRFCHETKKEFIVLSSVTDLVLKRGMLFIVISDDDLVALIQETKKSPFELGDTIGVISFNETELKKLLDITVVSTDFEQMGRTTASMILKGEESVVKNPFYLIKRKSI